MENRNVFSEEKVYIASNGIEVKYLEDPYGVANYSGKAKLLVVFQSLGDEKSDLPGERFPWSMVNGFRFLNCRKLYVKDEYGAVGCYYLGLNGKFDVEIAVAEFLSNKIISYGISLKNILMYGTSKGGYAALDFGFLLGAGHICAAVPQFDLLDWIYEYKPHLKYILPSPSSSNDMDEENKNEQIYHEYLKNRIIESKFNPQVSIITSLRDNTYGKHIAPLLETLRERKIEPEVYCNNELYITRHNNVVENSLNEIYYCILKGLMN